jgi:ATP-binding protein involved in chromosome partitioning
MPLPLIKEQPLGPLPGTGQVKHLVAIAAGKGGVGKSTVTVNIALALKEKGLKVGILDADLYGPSLRRMLPEDRLPAQAGKNLVPALCAGISMISMGFFRRQDEAAAVRAPIANGVISQFLNQVDWGPLDYLLIDFPPGTGDVQLTLAQQARLSGAVMVTTPQEVALMDVRKAIHLFHQVKVPVIGIIENMSYFLEPRTGEKLYLFGRQGGERLAAENGVPLLGQIPVDPALSRSGDQGISLFSEQSGAQPETLQTFRNAAEQVGEEIKRIAQQQGMLSKFYQKNPRTLTIEWLDGQETEFRLSDLQKHCPCAACVDEMTGKPLLDPHSVREDVGASQIIPIGRYAMRIRYTSGCSHGIYTYDMLYQLRDKR